MTDRHYKRRIMIVDSEFQFRFIRRLAMLVVLIVVASLLLLAIMSYFNLNIQKAVVQPIPLSLLKSIPPQEAPTTIIAILVPVAVACIAVTLGATLIFGIIISHRMAGPLFRIRRELRQMEQGDLSGDIRLRKKDDFQSLALTVNGLKETWRSHVQELNDIAKDLHPDPADPQSVKARLLNLVSRFKTG